MLVVVAAGMLVVVVAGMLVVEVAGMLVVVVAGMLVEEAAGIVAVEEGRLAVVVLDCRATVESAGVELVAEVAGILVLVVVPVSSQAQLKQNIPVTTHTQYGYYHCIDTPVLLAFCLCRSLALPVSIYPNGRRNHHGTFHLQRASPAKCPGVS